MAPDLRWDLVVTMLDVLGLLSQTEKTELSPALKAHPLGGTMSCATITRLIAQKSGTRVSRKRSARGDRRAGGKLRGHRQRGSAKDKELGTVNVGGALRYRYSCSAGCSVIVSAAGCAGARNGS